MDALVFTPKIKICREEIERLELSWATTSPDKGGMVPDQFVQPGIA